MGRAQREAGPGPGARGRGEHPPGRSRWLRPARAAGQRGVGGSREGDGAASFTVAFGQTSDQRSICK